VPGQYLTDGILTFATIGDDDNDDLISNGVIKHGSVEKSRRNSSMFFSLQLQPVFSFEISQRPAIFDYRRASSLPPGNPRARWRLQPLPSSCLRHLHLETTLSHGYDVLYIVSWLFIV